MVNNSQPNRKFSTRFIRKGPLIEETYRIFLEWDLDKPFSENIDCARKHNTPGADNESWLREITTTLSSLFSKDSLLDSLIILAKNTDLEIWRPCVLWHIGRIDEIYYRFATEWLEPEHSSGRFLIRTSDVEPFVRQLTQHRLIKKKKGLSDYGVIRAARDLLRFSTAFGLLTGTVVHEFTSYHLPEASFIYLLHAMSEVYKNPRDMIDSSDWHLYLMNSNDVERELLRLHQYRKLHYEVAGSLVELSLPCASTSAYVKEMLA